MFYALAFGIGAGIALQAWRNFPADGPVSPNMAAVVAVVLGVAGYLAGRLRRGRGGTATATATAVSSSESTATAGVVNHVNVQLLQVGGAVAAAPAALSVPSGDLPWVVGERPQLTADQLDGIELEALMPEVTGEPQASQ